MAAPSPIGGEFDNPPTAGSGGGPPGMAGKLGIAAAGAGAVARADTGATNGGAAPVSGATAGVSKRGASCAACGGTACG